MKYTFRVLTKFYSVLMGNQCQIVVDFSEKLANLTPVGLYVM